MVYAACFFALFGAVACFGESFTHGFHYKDIISNCDIRNNSYYQFEVSVYILVNILKLIAYLVFIATSFHFIQHYGGKEKILRKSTQLRKIKTISQTSFFYKIMQLTFLVSMSGCAIAIPILGFKRDEQYSKKCKSVNHVVIYFHAIVKLIDFISGWVVCAYIFYLSWRIANKWNSVPQYTIKCSVTDDIIEFVNQKFFFLYETYRSIGHNIQIELCTLKYWFCVQYLAYLISISFRFIHVLKPLFTSVDIENVALDNKHSIFYIFYDLFAFSVPFCMGIYFNYLHNICYEELVNELLTFKVTTPGGHCLVQTVTDNKEDNATYSKYEGEYKVYILKALEKSLKKEVNFDFVPCLFGISIPLDNPGYTFTIILTITTVIFSFIGVD